MNLGLVEKLVEQGLNKAQAAIDLKVPRSGIPELDAMIRESRRLDMATAAMVALIDARTPNGFGSGWPTHVERDAVLLADALLAASGKEEEK